MKRFLIFPIVLGICGAFFVTLLYVEIQPSFWALMGTSGISGASLSREIVGAFNLSWLPGCLAGIATGIGLAMWDLVRNKHNQSAQTRLLLNLFWCGSYVLSLIVVSEVFSALIVSQLDSYQTSLWLIRVVLIGIAITNLVAIFWAAIRSITTDDVLTPRVTRAKLRERMRLS